MRREWSQLNLSVSLQLLDFLRIRGACLGILQNGEQRCARVLVTISDIEAEYATTKATIPPPTAMTTPPRWTTRRNRSGGGGSGEPSSAGNARGAGGAGVARVAGWLSGAVYLESPGARYDGSARIRPR